MYGNCVEVNDQSAMESPEISYDSFCIFELKFEAKSYSADREPRANNVRTLTLHAFFRSFIR
jgi:hypothetical protein